MHRPTLSLALILALVTTVLVPAALLDGQEKTLRFALTPSEETTDQQMKRSQQVIQRLEKDLDLRVVPYTAADYVSIVEAMRAKKVDVAWLGSFSYVLAAQEAGAEAFVAGVRKSTGKASYTSLIFVRGDAPYQSVMDLKGKSFAFVDPASTSGHLFPRAGMMKMGITDPATFFSQVVFAGAHDAAQLAVLNRRVDGGASNDRVMDNLIKRGDLKPGDLRIIHRSDPIPLGPIAWRRDLPEATKAGLRRSFVGMRDVTFGTLGELTHFIEVSDRTYDIVRETATILKLDLKKMDD